MSDDEAIKSATKDILTRLFSKRRELLLALSPSELDARFSWKWDDGQSVEMNTYRFSRALESFARDCRTWEEHRNGCCNVVEFVRDTYLLPKIRMFITDLYLPRSKAP